MQVSHCRILKILNEALGQETGGRESELEGVASVVVTHAPSLPPAQSDPNPPPPHQPHALGSSDFDAAEAHGTDITMDAGEAGSAAAATGVHHEATPPSSPPGPGKKQQAGRDQGDSAAGSRSKMRVGAEFQAHVAMAAADGPCRCHGRVACVVGERMWAPIPATCRVDVDAYLTSTDQAHPDHQTIRREVSLRELMKANYNCEAALKAMSKIPPIFNVIISDRWSWRDVRNFEDGLIVHGKKFSDVKRDFLPTKKVSDLIHFYYFWKKSELHDKFIIRAPPCTMNPVEKRCYDPGATVHKFARGPCVKQFNFLADRATSSTTAELLKEVEGDLIESDVSVSESLESLPSHTTGGESGGTADSDDDDCYSSFLQRWAHTDDNTGASGSSEQSHEHSEPDVEPPPKRRRVKEAGEHKGGM